MEECILEGENGKRSEEEKKIEDSNEAEINYIAMSKAEHAKPTGGEDGNVADKTAENIQGENTEDMHVDMDKTAENIQGEITEDMNVDKYTHTEESKNHSVEGTVAAKAEHSEVLNEEDSKREISKDEGENDVERKDSKDVNAEDGEANSKDTNSNDAEKVNFKDENAKDGECKDVESVNAESAKEDNVEDVKMVDDGNIEGKDGSEDEIDGETKNEEEIDTKQEAANENSVEKVSGDENKGSEKKRSRGQKESQKGDGKEVNDGGSNAKLSSPMASPIMERPVRKKKTVARFVEVDEKDPGKEFKIEKGHGTPLRDIPNVAYRIARKKPMELKLIHYILFGRGGKYADFRSHILQFSGLVWHESDASYRCTLQGKKSPKTKEKLDKLEKKTLLDLCDFFDLSVSRSSSRKEDLITKLLDFLIAPHATTEVLLSEKDQLSAKTKKRKRMAVGSASKVKVDTPTKLSRKKQAKSGGSTAVKGSSDEETDGGENGCHDVSNKEKADSTMKKSTPKSDTKEKNSGKKLARGKSIAVEVETPSEEELRIKICKLLKEVDFSTATFTDILEQLAAHFKTDLTPRRASVKLLIQEELTKMAEEAEDLEDYSSDEEIPKPTVKKVKA